MVDRSTIRCFNCNELGYFATECRKPKQARKNSYDSNQKSKSERAYLPKGRSWDDTDSEDEEVGNLAGGGGNYPMFGTEKIDRQLSTDMTVLIADYFAEHPVVTATQPTNFKVTY